MSVPANPTRKARAPVRRKSRGARRLRCEPLERRDLFAADLFTPLAGDWNADGRDSLGLFNTASGQFYLRDINAPGFAHRVVTPAVLPTQRLPIAGDWDGDGRDSVGLYDLVAHKFLLFGDNGQLVAEQLLSGVSADARPVAGDWNGDRRDDVGVYSPSTQQVTLLVQGVQQTATINAAPLAHFDVVAGSFGSGSEEVAIVDRDRGLLLTASHAPKPLSMPGDVLTQHAVFGDWGNQGVATPGWYDMTSGLFTPWHTWSSDNFSLPFYAVPSANVQAHIDIALSNPWQNAWMPTDVDGDSLTTASDAVIVINTVNAIGARSLPEFREASQTAIGAIDTSGDYFLSPLDALLIINRLNSGSGNQASNGEPPVLAAMPPQLTAAEVETLLARAAAASSTNNAIIAVVDRGGRILGVRTESDVVATFANDTETLVFAIDGAVAKARTAAFFSSNEAPLTSRTVRFISQSTVAQREVQSNPNVGDMSSTFQGPGFVAPVGTGGHFPPGVNFTPPVDLFAIEHTNRDSLLHPGEDGLKGTPDDIALASRFNVDVGFIPYGQAIEAPESYGYTSGQFEDAQSRGIATLPGGVPLYRNGVLVGGIGVFFPGADGTATFEQNFAAGVGQSEYDRLNAPKALEAEWIAFAAAGGVDTSQFPSGKIDTINGIPLPDGLRLPFGRIDLGGITLEIYGPHPTAGNTAQGVNRLLQIGASVGLGNAASGTNQFVTPGLDNESNTADDEITRNGLPVPQGWLVLPHASAELTAAQVEQVINQGVAEATLVRAAIRLPIGQRTKMVFAVSDLDGNVLGLYRMPDATVFSIDVAVAKARNEAYYADASALLDIDRVDDDRNGVPDDGVPAGVALTARTFRFLAEPRYPAGIDGTTPGAFSILREPGINPVTAENIGAPLPASAFTTTVGFDAFHVGRNFRDPDNIANQNGIVFFPGSTPLYVGALAGGYGVSGDGVDQDDVVTAIGAAGYLPPTLLRADQYFVRGTRLPFQKFLRNPHG